MAVVTPVEMTGPAPRPVSFFRRLSATTPAMEVMGEPTTVVPAALPPETPISTDAATPIAAPVPPAQAAAPQMAPLAGPPTLGAPTVDCGCGDCGKKFCGPSGRFWADADALLWWMKGTSLPPLATSGSATAAIGQPGALGAEGTTVLFGGKHENSDARFGGRLVLGGWVDEEQTLGGEVNFMILENKTTNFGVASTGTPLLARPFINALTNQQAARIVVGQPGVLSGNIAATAQTDGLIGAGILARECLICRSCWRIDVLGGYRYMQFADRLGITETQVGLGAGGGPGVTAVATDRFDASNEFHGFDFGFAGEWRTGPWIFKGLAKLAVGSNTETVSINGATTVTDPGNPPVRLPGGLLALPTNIGTLDRERGIIIPELGVQAGLQLTRNIRAHVGWSLIYWSEAVWAGKNIDFFVNPEFIPPGAGGSLGRPAPTFQATSLWANGFDLGVEVRY